MKSKNIFNYLLIFIVSISFVHAFGIATQYTVENPLKVYPGQTTDFDVLINNKGGSTEMSAKGGIISGNEIAKIINPKEIYTAKIDEALPVKIRVTIPKDAPIGKEYIIIADFTQVGTQDNTGMVSMGVGVTRHIKVVVTNNEALPAKTFPWVMIILVSIIIILIIGYFLWKKSKSPAISQTTTQNPPEQPTQVK